MPPLALVTPFCTPLLPPLPAAGGPILYATPPTPRPGDGLCGDRGGGPPHPFTRGDAIVKSSPQYPPPRPRPLVVSPLARPPPGGRRHDPLRHRRDPRPGRRLLRRRGRRPRARGERPRRHRRDRA